MEYATLDGIPAKLSRIVQGSVMVSSDDQDAANALLDAVYEHGGRTFDTAHGYGGGKSERALGAWITSRGIRDEVVILGKGAHPYDGRARVTPEDITSDLHESLERMGVDVIDLYVLHRDNTDVPVGPLVEVLNEHQRAGKIRQFGGSNWTTARIGEANQYAAEHGLNPFTVISRGPTRLRRLAANHSRKPSAFVIRNSTPLTTNMIPAAIRARSRPVPNRINPID